MKKELSFISVTNWKTFDQQCARHGWDAAAVIDEATTWAFENGFLGHSSFAYDIWEWKDLTGDGFRNQVATTVRFTLKRPEINTWEDDEGNEFVGATPPDGSSFWSIWETVQNAEYHVEVL